MNEQLTTKKPTPMKIAIGAVLILGTVIYYGVGQYTKHAIQGTWKCSAGDGRIAGLYEFSDHSNYLETHSRTEQYYGDYEVDWKTIKTSIVGTTVGRINADEKNPIRSEIDFVEKSNGGLVLKIWPESHPTGVAVFCEKSTN
jgi:hypothetical protein